MNKKHRGTGTRSINAVFRIRIRIFNGVLTFNVILKNVVENLLV